MLTYPVNVAMRFTYSQSTKDMLIKIENSFIIVENDCTFAPLNEKGQYTLAQGLQAQFFWTKGWRPSIVFSH